MDVTEILRELEASLLTYAVRKDRARVAELLGEDFREFGRSGAVYTKAQILELLQDELEIRVEMEDFACQRIAGEVALVTYRSVRTEPNGAVIEALRSSLWGCREGRWQMVFHQGTPLGTSGAAPGTSAETRVKA